MQPPSCSCQCKRHSNQAVAARETVRCFQRRQQPNSSDTLLLSAPTRSPACASKYGRLPKRQAAGFYSCDTCVHGDEVVLSRANTALLLLKPRACSCRIACSELTPHSLKPRRSPVALNAVVCLAATHERKPWRVRPTSGLCPNRTVEYIC